MVNGFMVNGYWKYIYCFQIRRFYVPIQREPEINEKKKISNPTVPPIASILHGKTSIERRKLESSATDTAEE